MCLRSSLVALREMNAGFLGLGSHQSCVPSTCRVDCVRNLQFDMDHYVSELSGAILKKENIRSRKWWLTAFYSFCIQSFVRKALILLVEPLETVVPSMFLGSQTHLYTAIRLFTVITGNCNPLSQQAVTELSIQLDESEKFLVEHYQVAQLSVSQDKWAGMGLTNSGDYLKRLFEDDEPTEVETSVASSTVATVEPVEPRQVYNTPNFTIRPQPYLPKTFNIETYRIFRSNWDFARREYTKHVVVIVKLYGWESEVYLRTERTWAYVDAIWKRNGTIVIANILKANKHTSSETLSTPGQMKRSFKLDILLANPNHRGHASPLDIYASTRRLPDAPNTSRPLSDEEIYDEEPRFKDDMYWPRWLRGSQSAVQEGWCGMCQPGRWLALDGPYQDDKDFSHGISGCTGKPYVEPMQVGFMEGMEGIWWGLCSTCDEWIELVGEKEGERAWFVHAFGCYV